MLDLRRCKFVESKEIPVADGFSVNVEGAPLVRVIEDGIEKIKIAAGEADEQFVGFSFGEIFSPLNKSFVHSAVIPAAVSYTVQLPKNNLVAGQILVYDNTSGAALAEGDPASSGKYSCDDATGLLTFNAAQAGHSITVTFRYLPTAQEVIMQNNVRLVSQYGADFLGSLGCILEGEIFTDQFDASVDWASATAVNLGDGILTSGGSGESTPCQVIAVPSADRPFLGVRF